MDLLLPAVLGGVGAGVPAFLARRWLDSRAHRYEDEVDIRHGAVAWLLPVAVVVGALVALAWHARPALAVLLVAASVLLLVLAAIDVDVRRLPDNLTYPLFVGSLVGLLVVGVIEDDLDAWVRALFGAAALGGFYFALILIGGGHRMGQGDVKLSPSLGLLLGYLSWSHVFVGTVVCFLSAGLAAVILLARGAGRKSHLAFGPYMVAGALVVLVVPAVGLVA